MDRRETVKVFRTRLTQLIRHSELSHTAFAGAACMDRSTLSQLLSPANDRLPRVDSLVGIAQVSQVSLDWMLGLTHADASHADVSADTLQIERDAPSPIDERLLKWHAEAAGYKIRHVPTTFPDVLKTNKVIDFEYDHFFALTPRRHLCWANVLRVPCNRASSGPGEPFRLIGPQSPCLSTTSVYSCGARF